MDKLELSFIIFISFAIIIMSFSDYSDLDNSVLSNNGNMSIKTIILKTPQFLGGTDNGTVSKTGPYGNTNATQKIAFVVGVHPLEINSHKAMVQSIINLKNSSKWCYYIYSVHVAMDRESYNNGRMNGQILAYNVAVPDIIANNYDLVIDVHSNRGDNFKQQYFLYVPENEAKSVSIANKLITNIPKIVYYIPPNEDGPKSPIYVTIPIISSGKPAIIYETYRYDPYEVTLNHAMDFINSIEKINIKE